MIDVKKVVLAENRFSTDIIDINFLYNKLFSITEERLK